MAKPAVFVRAGMLAGYVDLARSLGLDTYRLLRGVGLDRFDLSAVDGLIPAAAVSELLERSAEAAGVEDFGLRLATKRNFAQLGAIGLVVREEPTVGRAIRAAEQYFRLHSETLALRLEERDELALLRVQYLSMTQGRTRQTTELIVGTTFHTLNVLAGRAWGPESACFSHPAPKTRTIHNTFFGTRTLFDSTFDGFVLGAGNLDAPIRSADTAMAYYFRRYVDEVIGQPAVTIDGRVRQLVFALLPSGRCSGDLIAQHLGVDRRTVNRRLAARGETFSSILNDVRVELAQRHIKTERRSLTETAQLLGFSGLSTFSRWFRSEFGANARDWRRAQIGT